MTTDEYVLLIIQQIKVVKNCNQVEMIIVQSVQNMVEKKKNGFIIQRYLTKLQSVLEDLSPLNCKSDQWSLYRCALIYVRELLTVKHAEN
ncbi:hypothetical protein [Chitinophaga sp. CB10]|jgi:hypothetical protein|uniref:hypothetical protein n=1 Tax=Chitinophaga sp. CB10 TaxID=1891659 RepID=UPI0025B7CE7C|nr:hypothetical protein [Chitinophaga sp. CB10]